MSGYMSPPEKARLARTTTQVSSTTIGESSMGSWCLYIGTTSGDESIIGPEDNLLFLLYLDTNFYLSFLPPHTLRYHLTGRVPSGIYITQLEVLTEESV